MDTEERRKLSFTELSTDKQRQDERHLESFKFVLIGTSCNGVDGLF